MTSTRWSEQETLKLIELYKSYDFLWDKNTPLYKNIFARKQAYEAIVNEMDVMGLTSQDVRCKIKNLRTSYYQELRKIASCKLQNKVLKPLRWFLAFKSVMGNINTQEKPAKVQESNSESEEYELEEEEEEEETGENQSTSLFIEEPALNSDAYVVSIKQEFLDEMDNLGGDKSMPPAICDYLEPVIHPRRQNAVPTQQTPQEYKKPEEEIMPLPVVRKKSKSGDEFQMFANNIAQQLRKLPLNRALNLQVEVQRMIARERIEMLDKQMASKTNEEDSS